MYTPARYDLLAYMKQASLRSFDEWSRSIRNYELLFGDTELQGTDVDMLMERRGHFLVLEGKPLIDGQVFLPLGQYIAFKALAAVPNFTVFIVGERGKERRSSRTAYSVADMGQLPRTLPKRFHGGSRCAVVGRDHLQPMSVVGLRNVMLRWKREAEAA